MTKLAFAALLSLALALLLSASGCYTEAEQHYNFGTRAQDSGHYIQAIKEYSEAIRLDPEYVDAYNARGTAYDDLGLHERAIEDYNEAIRLDPEYAMAYYNRGYAYYDLGQYDKANQDYNEAVRLGGPLDFWTEYK